MKHLKIQAKYFLKLNERLVELLFDHSDLMSEQSYITWMNISKERQETWSTVKDILDGKPVPHAEDRVMLDILERHIAIAEMCASNIRYDLRCKKKKQLK